MQLDSSVKRFLCSKFGHDIVYKAYMNGQEFFKFGKKKYPVNELKRYVDMVNVNLVT